MGDPPLAAVESGRGAAGAAGVEFVSKGVYIE